MPDTQKNVYKKLLGRKGENLVAKHLKKQGCKILKRNFVTPFGEADLIVEDGDETVFVEVKTRTSERFGTPAEAVGLEKQKRYYKIAQFYGLQIGEEPNARFDVVQVFADGRIDHIKNAF